MRYALLLVSLIALLQSTLLQSALASETKPSVSLKQLEQLISQTQSSLASAHHTQQLLNQQLQSTQRSISQVGNRVSQLQQRYSDQNQHLTGLQRLHQQANQALFQQQNFLAQQLRAIYLLQLNQPSLGMLSQADFTQLSLNAWYYRYLQQAELTRMANTQQTLQTLATAQTHLIEQQQELQSLLHQQRDTKIQLLAQQQQKQQALQSVQTHIQKNTQQLQKLLAEKKALAQVLKQLEAKAKAQAPLKLPADINRKPFAALQGQLPWPTQGKISIRFASPIGQTGLKYTGVVLAAPLQQPVYAIYPGRVVFAHYLQGFGLLLIIEHGQGYMSLYGHNQSLLKKVGDQVAAGTLIAKVGNSDNNNSNSTGLYFEIRHNGQAINPENWCTNRSR